MVEVDPFNPIALRKAKIVYNFGLSECSRVNLRQCKTMKAILSSYVLFIVKLYICDESWLFTSAKLMLYEACFFCFSFCSPNLFNKLKHVSSPKLNV